MLVTLLALAATHVLGLKLVLFACLLAGTALLGFASPRAFALLVLALAPLPSLGAIVGASVPVGLDPVDVLAVIGLGIASLRTIRSPLRGRRMLQLAIALSYGLLVVAWLRTYAYGSLSGTTIALIVKPLIMFAAALIVIQLLPLDNLVETIAVAMGAVIALIAVSVILQRLGAYQVANQSERGIKQYGGLMLSGNSAGLMLSLFGVPTYVLLRSVGRTTLGVALLLLEIPVLLITLSRTSMIVFGTSLLLLMLFDRQRVNAIKLVVAIGLLGAIWAKTAGASQVRFMLDFLQQHANDRNATLSGRPRIWSQALAFLGQGKHWVVGGGLNSFHTVGLGGSVQGYSTHNMYLDLLTTGGILMLAGTVFLIFAIWSATRGADPAFATAIRLVLLGVLLTGLSSNFDFLSRTASWIWVLTAVMCRLVAEPTAARPAAVGARAAGSG